MWQGSNGTQGRQHGMMEEPRKQPVSSGTSLLSEGKLQTLPRLVNYALLTAERFGDQTIALRTNCAALKFLRAKGRRREGLVREVGGLLTTTARR